MFILNGKFEDDDAINFFYLFFKSMKLNLDKRFSPLTFYFDHTLKIISAAKIQKMLEKEVLVSERLELGLHIDDEYTSENYKSLIPIYDQTKHPIL